MTNGNPISILEKVDPKIIFTNKTVKTPTQKSKQKSHLTMLKINLNFVFAPFS